MKKKKENLSLVFLVFLFLEDNSTFCGATDTPVLDFWRHMNRVSKPWWMEWIPQIHLGATPADLLMASMAVKSFQSTCLQASIGEARVRDRTCHCRTACDKTDALTTEGGRLDRYFLSHKHVCKYASTAFNPAVVWSNA